MNFLDALSPIGSFISGVSNAIGSSIQFNQQKRLMEQQYKNQIDFWNMNNEYNTPKNQLQRLQDAGVNPFIQYSGNNSSSYGSVMQKIPQVPNYVSAGVNSMMQVLRTISEIKNINAQTENQKAQASRAEHQNAVDDSQVELNHILERMRSKEYDALDQEIYLRQTLASKQIRLFDANYEAVMADANLKTSQYKLNMYDYENVKPLQVSLLDGQIQQLNALRSQLEAQTKLTKEQVNLVMAQIALTLQQKNYTFALEQRTNQSIAINRPQQILSNSYSSGLTSHINGDKNRPTYAGMIGLYNAEGLHAESFNRTYHAQFNLQNARFQSLTAQEQYNLLSTYGGYQMASQIFNNYVGSFIGLGNMSANFIRSNIVPEFNTTNNSYNTNHHYGSQTINSYKYGSY